MQHIYDFFNSWFDLGTNNFFTVWANVLTGMVSFYTISVHTALKTKLSDQHNSATEQEMMHDHEVHLLLFHEK